MTRLRGVTWDHPRGLDPMVATARDYAARHPGVEITWDTRPLQAFADQPLDRLSAEYDLLVIDHPHVGAASTWGCLIPLDTTARDSELRDLAAHSIGPSHESYTYAGHQWALAIDAAAQVAAYRPDLIDGPPRTWDEVAALARTGRVHWPLKPVDALMSFFTLAANRGTPCVQQPDVLIDEGDGLAVLEAMQAVARYVPPECLAMNPIQTLDVMSQDDSCAYCPLLFCYSNYSRSGFRKRLIRFTNIPALGSNGPVGSILGGTGLAISASSAAPEVAVDYAFWVAGADCQKGIYFASGGQPAHAAAWDDDAVNAACHGFFRSVRETLNQSWLRPRHPGYLDFQDQGGTLLNAFLARPAYPEDTMRRLQGAYQDSLV